MRTGNPALNDKTFENFGVYARDSIDKTSATMSINGTVHKTLFLLLLAFGSACFTWSRTFEGNAATAMPWILGGAIGGFVCAIGICFKHTLSPWLAPVYAIAEGLFWEVCQPVLSLSTRGLSFRRWEARLEPSLGF